MNSHVPGLFITGTDTEVGKTYVAALIARSLVVAGYKVGVYKPAASGCRRDGDVLVSDDAIALWEAAGRPGELDRVCPQRFIAPLAPHLAARAEGKRVDAELLRRGIEYWRQRSEIVLVEGVGGLLSPIGEEDYVADLAEQFALPLVVVSKNVLGTINATLQTLVTAATFRGWHGVACVAMESPTCPRFARACHPGLEIAGVVLNNPTQTSDDASRTTNRLELSARCIPPMLAEVAYGADDFDTQVDWFALAGITARCF